MHLYMGQVSLRSLLLPVKVNLGRRCISRGGDGRQTLEYVYALRSQTFAGATLWPAQLRKRARFHALFPTPTPLPIPSPIETN